MVQYKQVSTDWKDLLLAQKLQNEKGVAPVHSPSDEVFNLVIDPKSMQNAR